MTVSIVAFTGNGARLCQKLLDTLPFHCEGFAPGRFCTGRLLPLETPVREWAGERFLPGEVLLFIGAAGIAVRAVAPFVSDKRFDPAVLAMDEQGNYIVPLLSGHLGGANRLAQELAAATGAVAVLSTATDLNGVFAADVWAAESGCLIRDASQIKHISAALLEGEGVGLYSEFPVDGELPEHIQFSNATACGIVISLHPRDVFPHTLGLVPRCLTVGAGCRKGIDPERFERNLASTLESVGLPLGAVNELATINLKAEEPAMRLLCEKYDLSLRVFTPEELSAAEGEFASSAFVQQVTGVDNVCERAASLCGTVIIPKTAVDGATFAVAVQKWRARF